jgi:hypothetical protein
VLLPALWAMTSLAVAGELVPYQLPAPRPASSVLSTQIAAQQNSVAAQAKPSRAVDETTYQNFAGQVKTLPQPERDALVRNFTQARDAALRSGDSGRAVHYFRLLDILQKAPQAHP